MCMSVMGRDTHAHSHAACFVPTSVLTIVA